MINKFEISRKGKEFGLQSSTIEKDYVLGWMLIGIQNHPQTRDSWVFKGGTCLKKCFFNRYRFSEDLDFTLLNSQQMKEESLRPILKEIAQWVYEQSGIEIPENLISLDPHRSLSVQGKLSYRGPLKQPVPYPSIKLDLTANEQIVLRPEKRAAIPAELQPFKPELFEIDVLVEFPVNSTTESSKIPPLLTSMLL